VASYLKNTNLIKSNQLVFALKLEKFNNELYTESDDIKYELLKIWFDKSVKHLITKSNNYLLLGYPLNDLKFNKNSKIYIRSDRIVIQEYK